MHHTSFELILGKVGDWEGGEKGEVCSGSEVGRKSSFMYEKRIREQRMKERCKQEGLSWVKPRVWGTAVSFGREVEMQTKLGGAEKQTNGKEKLTPAVTAGAHLQQERRVS